MDSHREMHSTKIHAKRLRLLHRPGISYQRESSFRQFSRTRWEQGQMQLCELKKTVIDLRDEKTRARTSRKVCFSFGIPKIAIMGQTTK